MTDMKFSVCMSVYKKDNPEHFRVAVESILNQTVQPNEVVLVVDGPVPEILDSVIAEYEQNSIFKVVRLEENQGLGQARRIGLSKTSHDLVAMMDADDISVSDRFEIQLSIFKKDSEVDVVGGIITEFVGDAANLVAKRHVPQSDSEIKTYMKTRCPMNHMTVMCKKASVERAGGYLDWYFNEDYYLWIRMMMARMKFANVMDILVNVRVGKEMYQRRGGVKYFLSEAKLQKYMLDNKIIDFGTFVINVCKRLIVQVLLPNKLRSWVFQKFARKAV